MRLQRFGHLIDTNDYLHITASEIPPSNMASNFNEDIIITVNEILADGKVRLGVSTPTIMEIKQMETHDIAAQTNTNALLLQRALGSSVIIRKQENVSAMDALRDLRSKGIYIRNSTKPLSRLVDKTGSELFFYANQTIWKIIRLELTLLRRAKI